MNESLPPGWERKKLSEICEKITDGTHQTPTYFDNGVIFLSSRNVTSGKIDWDNIKFIDTKQHLAMHKRVAPKMNDILLAKNGTTGVAAIVDRDVIFDIYVSLALLRSLGVIRPDLLLYFINSPLAKKQFNKRLKGIGVPNLHLEEIREVVVPFPKSLPEQKRIVAVLDEALGAIDTAKENAERNLQNARELFESYLQSVFSNPGAGWEKKTFDEVCEISSKLIDPRESEFVDQLHVGGANIESKTGALIELKTAREEKLISGKFAFDETMVLYSKIRPYLIKVARPDFIGLCSADIYPLKPLPNEVTRDFLYYLLISNEFTQYAIAGSARAGMPKVNREHLFAFKLSRPSIADQHSIVKKLDSLSFEVKRLEAIYEQKRASLDELKKSILEKAFRGERLGATQ